MRLILMLLLALVWCSQAQAERIALLIGNADYNTAVGALDNPHNDVVAIRSALLQAGFQSQNIRIVEDASRVALLRAVTDFARRAETLSANDVAFFYYSGHGARNPLGQSMSLIPTDVTTVDTEDFWFETVDLNNEVINVFTGPNGNRSPAAWVVAIDACRNELRLPQRALGGGAKSFGVVPTTAGMLISFAADTGETAADKVTGSTRLSPYAKVLSEELVKPGQSLSNIFNEVRPRVRRLTGNAQQPVVTNRLNTNPFLIAARPAVSDSLTAERALFLAAQSCEDYQSYVARYPKGEFLSVAEVMLGSSRCTGPKPSTTLSTGSMISAEAAAEAYKAGLRAYDSEDYVTARLEYTKACDGDLAKGCTNLGVLYEKGYGVTQDYAQARSLYQKGCDGGNAVGCTNLGVIYRNGYGVAKDYARARTLYQKGCDGGNALGCTNLGFLYNEGYGVAQDYAQARTLYQKGCDGGNAIGCANLAYLYEKGYGGAQDYAQARTLYQKGCDGGNARGCTNLGVFYRDGHGGAQDYAQARKLYQKGCDGGNATGCANLAYLYEKGYGVARDYAQARTLYQEGCDGGNAIGCSNLGNLLYQGLGGPEDQTRGAERVRQGCAGGNQWGCNWLDQRDLSR